MRLVLFLIAVLVVLLPPLVHAQSAKRETRGLFGVITYNIHGIPPFVTGDNTEMRTRYIAKHIAQMTARVPGTPIIFKLQENFICVAIGGLYRWENGLEKYLPKTARVALFNGRSMDRMCDSGLLVFASLGKIVTHKNAHYRVCAPNKDDCLASKGFQLVRWSPVFGVELDFWNTHLDSGDEPEDVDARAKQFTMLSAAIARESNGRAIVVSGDFNVNWNNAHDRDTFAGFVARLRLTDADKKPGRLDRILIRSGEKVRLVLRAFKNLKKRFQHAGADLSDHHPLGAKINWELIP